MNSAIEIVEIKLDYSNQLIDELRSRIEKLEEENLKPIHYFVSMKINI